MTARRSGRADKLILRGSDPSPRPSNHGDHSALWERLSGVERGLAELRGRVSVTMAIDIGTFLAVAGLLLTKAF